MTAKFECGTYLFTKKGNTRGELIEIYDGDDGQQYWHYYGSRTPYVVHGDFTAEELVRMRFIWDSMRPSVEREGVVADALDARQEVADLLRTGVFVNTPPPPPSLLRLIGATEALRLIGTIAEALDAQEIVYGVTTHLSVAREKLEELRVYCVKDA